MTKQFYSVGGEILGESAGSGAMALYLTDALGSVTTTSANTASTSRYSPYGEKGSAPANATLGWVGSRGYRPTSRSFSSHYMQARHYAAPLGGWTSRDPLAHYITRSHCDSVTLRRLVVASRRTNSKTDSGRPLTLRDPDLNLSALVVTEPRTFWVATFADVAAYRYAASDPTSRVDPMGLWCIKEYGGPTKKNIDFYGGEDVGMRILNSIGSDPNWSKFLECLQGCPRQYPQELGNIEDIISAWQSQSAGCDDPSFEVVFAEGGWFPLINKCNDANTCCFSDIRSRPPKIHICQKNRGNCGPRKCQVAHELIHIAGVIHTKDDHWFNCVRLLSGCENYTPSNVHHEKE